MSNGLPQLADQLAVLFATVTRDPEGTQPHTSATVAQALQGMGIQVSQSTIDHLRSGRSANPSAVLLDGLARLFCVPIGFFLEPERQHDKVLEDLQALLPLREPRLQNVMRLCQGMSVESLDDLVVILEMMRRRDGLPALPPSPVQG